MNGNSKDLPVNPYATRLRELADGVESGQVQFLVVLDGSNVMTIGQYPPAFLMGFLLDVAIEIRTAAHAAAKSQIQVVPSLAGLN